MQKEIVFNVEVLNSLLTYSLNNHPYEGILLLRGKVGKDKVEVENVTIPPMSVRGIAFSSFPLHMLPLDSSIIGTAHSHPSGFLEPSLDDLHHFYGIIMVIIRYPYRSVEDVGVFDREGRKLSFTVKK
ncbi:MAG: Mov34/MPN/PAD-1 family protein [Nitrososphaeria archaeon]|nr:Mov34/MPN/PAD-1 family protein [Nitrososphaeria archaeon]